MFCIHRFFCALLEGMVCFLHVFFTSFVVEDDPVVICLVR